MLNSFVLRDDSRPWTKHSSTFIQCVICFRRYFRLCSDPSPGVKVVRSSNVLSFLSWWVTLSHASSWHVLYERTCLWRDSRLASKWGTLLRVDFEILGFVVDYAACILLLLKVVLVELGCGLSIPLNSSNLFHLLSVDSLLFSWLLLGVIYESLYPRFDS